MSTSVAISTTEHDPNDMAFWTRAQVREHDRQWARRFVAEHPERHLVLLDTPGRTEITHRLPHLRAWRECAGWTQAELSLRSGVATKTISRLELGHTTARIGMVEALATALGLENTTLSERAPADDESPVPTLRIQAVEETPGDLRFYLHHLWMRVEHYAGGLDALAAAVGIAPDELRAVRNVEEPAPWSLVERLSRTLGTPALELMAWD